MHYLQVALVVRLLGPAGSGKLDNVKLQCMDAQSCVYMCDLDSKLCDTDNYPCTTCSNLFKQEAESRAAMVNV